MSRNTTLSTTRARRDNRSPLQARIRARLLILLLALLPAAGTATATETITLATYHTHAPFLDGSGEGLSDTLARELTARSDGAYRFELQPMSRPRLNRLLEAGDRIAVPWVSPVWFGDADRTRYHWPDAVLMQDGNAIVSPMARPVIYDGPQSLEGLVFGGQRGHRYTGIDDFIEQSPTTRRINGDSHDANLDKIERGLVDVTLVPDSAVRNVIRARNLAKVLFISPTPHSSYARHMLVSGGDRQLNEFLDRALAELVADPAWGERIGQ